MYMYIYIGHQTYVSERKLNFHFLGPCVGSPHFRKPPPNSRPDAPHIGWRTEFRSMEIPLTDFENAAFTAFMASGPFILSISNSNVM